MSDPPAPNRRLVAILAADIAGYSALMGADEEGTVRALKGHQAAVLPMIAEQGGRVIDTAGDGILAEFSSVLNAVRCALAIQQVMASRNVDVEPAKAMRFRIGVNQGDVVFDEARIYGDGINIAARLEALAEPGGVTISAKVHEEVRDRIDAAFDDLGEKELKNITRPVRVFAVRPARQAEPSRLASMSLPPELPERPSVAVLPFQNMSRDAEQDHFADGIVEDIITALSRLRWCFVIARNSSFTYKGLTIDVRDVGRQLGVRYVVEGSVRVAGNRVRVTAQLIDAVSNSHVWAEKYDATLDDIFDVQDEIVRSVAASLQTQILIHDEDAQTRAQRPDLTVWQLVKKAWISVYKLNREGLEDAIRLAREAIARDPDSQLGYEALACGLTHSVLIGFTGDAKSLSEEALLSARRAVELNPKSEVAHWIHGVALGYLFGRHDQGCSSLQQSIDINPNYSLGYGSLGTMLVLAGKPDDGIHCTQIAIRLNPRDPSIFFRYSGLALGYLLKDDLQQSLDWSQKSAARNPDWWLAHALVAAVNTMLGNVEAGRAALVDLRRILPEVTVTSLRWRSYLPHTALERVSAALRLAGLPE